MYNAPQDKFDIEAITKLTQAHDAVVIPLLPQLLTWLQDMNWPVAEPTAVLLLQYPNEITPLLQDILQGDDWDWQYWCLKRLIPNLPFYLKIVLADDVERIASIKEPNYEDYAVAAKDALDTFMP